MFLVALCCPYLWEEAVPVLKIAGNSHFLRSKKIYYNDAELHFMLAKYYLHVNDCELALFYIDECLKLIPDYYPAHLLKQKIEERWF